MSAIDQPSWTEFTQLFAGDAEAVSEIVTIYLDESEMLKDKLLAGIAANDATAVERAAHSLKSTSNQLGARELGALCARLEAAGHEGDMDTIKALADDFTRHVHDAQGGLRQRIV